MKNEFSIDHDLHVENPYEETLVAQRQVYDGIKECGGIFSVNIDKSLIHNVGMANVCHKELLCQGSKIEDRPETECQGLKRALEQIKRPQEKKAKLYFYY